MKNYISAIQTFELIKDHNYILIDIRDNVEKEIISFDISNKLEIPIDDIKNHKFDKNKFYIISCKSGNRALQISEFFIHNNLKYYILEGGIMAWYDNELPVLLSNSTKNYNI